MRNRTDSGQRRMRRWQVVTLLSLGAATVLVGALVVSGATRPAAPAVTSTASSTAAPIPATVHVAASFGHWTADGAADQATTFSADAGESKDGRIALLVDRSSKSGQPLRTLVQDVPTQPSTTYFFSAWVQSSGSPAKASNVTLAMGASEPAHFDFPAVGATWTRVTWSHKTALAESTLRLSIAATGPTSGLRIDKLTMTADGKSKNLVTNGSFEDYTAPTQITNSSLIFQSGKANLGIAWRTPAINWSIADQNGKAVAHGRQPLPGGLGFVPLGTLQQGYYTVDLTSADKTASQMHTSLLVLDNADAGASTSDGRFGVTVHIGRSGYTDVEPTAAQLGFRTVRTDATWSLVETQKNQYSYPPAYDTAYRAYATQGVSVLPIIDYRNKWYDAARTPSTPAGIAAFSNYAAAFVDHYSTPAVEIYNEFNNPPLNNSTCGLTAACYLPLLQASYQKVKAAHPNTIVVGPATAHQDDAWLTALYQAGGLKYLDAVSFHPYDSSGPPEFLIASLQQATARIKQYNNGQSKPIWITELGCSTADMCKPADQGTYLVRAEAIALANGASKFFWYDLVNDSPNPADHEGNFGILTPPTATVAAFAPKPAAMAQAMISRKIANKPFVAADPLNGSTYSYVFGSGSKATRVAWATTPVKVNYATKNPVTVTTMYGKVTKLSPKNGIVSISLSGNPVYVDGLVTKASIG